MSRIKITKQIVRASLKPTALRQGSCALFVAFRQSRIELKKMLISSLDEHGIFVYYPLWEIQDNIGCSDKTAIKVLVELFDAGLIERRHGQSADRIYIL